MCAFQWRGETGEPIRLNDGAGDAGPELWAGSGSPEGVVTAPRGSTYRRTDDGLGIQEYTKLSPSGNTGWAAVPVQAARFVQLQSVSQAVPTSAPGNPILFGDPGPVQFPIVSYSAGTFTMLRNMLVRIEVSVGTNLSSGNNRFAEASIYYNSSQLPGSEIRLWMTNTVADDTGFGRASGEVAVDDEVEILIYGDLNVSTIPDATSVTFILLGDQVPPGAGSGTFSSVLASKRGED